jgi:hypothetical protein
LDSSTTDFWLPIQEDRLGMLSSSSISKQALTASAAGMVCVLSTPFSQN